MLNVSAYPLADLKFWFIGMEEGLGKMSSQDTVRNLKARASFEKTMDLREAHMRLQEGGRPIDIEKKTLLLRSGNLWRRLCGPITETRNGEI